MSGRVVGLIVCVVVLRGCAGHGAGSDRPGAQGVDEPAGLANVIECSPGVLSGSEPLGDAAFRSLADLGVRTVVSVDAARPDVETAARFGLRYVHVPVRYSGISPQERAAVAKAIGTSDGRVYVHCHHGVHRGPAAAAAALVTLGRLDPDGAVDLMRRAGTSPRYPGLYRAVEQAGALEWAQIDALAGDLVAVSEPGDLASAMARADRAMEHLRLIARAGWRTPVDHPDLVARAEAGVVHDAMRAAARMGGDRPPEYARLLERAISATAALERVLAPDVPDALAADAAFQTVEASCLACHRRYRDAPW